MYKTFADLKVGDSIYLIKRPDMEVVTYKVTSVGKCGIDARNENWAIFVDKMKSPFVELESAGHDFVFSDINMMLSFCNGWFTGNGISQMLIPLHK